jgi:hypothetical protein
VGVITNSWPAASPSAIAYESPSEIPLPNSSASHAELHQNNQSHSRANAHLPEALFILESWQVGLRKPAPEIFQLAFQKLRQSPQLHSLQPNEVLFADDIGANLKPAQALGWKTVLVRGDGRAALAEIADCFNVPLPPVPAPGPPPLSSQSPPSPQSPPSSQSKAGRPAAKL